MTRLVANSQLNMYTFLTQADLLGLFQAADVLTHTASILQIKDVDDTQEVLTLTGSFGGYNSDMYPTTGTVTGGSYLPGNTSFGSFSFSGASISVVDFTNYVNSSNTFGLFQQVLQGDDQIVGSAFNDVLYGFAGNDLMDGGAGNDVMYGGTGSDTYIVDSPGDLALESTITNEGTDTVQSSVTYTLGTFVENLTLTGSASISGYGNSSANVIIGNASSNGLEGGAGADLLVGNGGADELHGGDGNDQIWAAGYRGDPSGTDFGGNHLFGDAGDDQLISWLSNPGSSPDVLTGGAGKDLFFLDTTPGSEDHITDFDYGEKAYSSTQTDVSTYVIFSSDTGTKVNFLDDAMKVGTFVFDTRILPGELTVARDLTSSGPVITVGRDFSLSANVTKAAQAIDPQLDALARYIAETIKVEAMAKFGKVTEKAIQRAGQFVSEYFLQTNFARDVTATALQAFSSVFKGLTPDQILKMGEHLTASIADVTLGKVVNYLIHGPGEYDPYSNDYLDIAKIITSPFQIDPEFALFMRLSDHINNAIAYAIEQHFTSETSNLLASLPDTATGPINSIDINGGKASILESGAQVTSDLGTIGVDTVYTPDSINALPDNIENATLLDPAPSAPQEKVSSALVNAAATQDLIGNALDNRLIGNSNDNLIRGQAGDDLIAGGRGNDFIDGGDGSDTAVYSGSRQDYSITFNAGQYTITDLRGLDGQDTVIGIEKFSFADGIYTAAEVVAAPAVSLAGDANPNLIDGSYDNRSKIISGLAGNDQLIGSIAADQITGGAGQDLLAGGGGNDTFSDTAAGLNGDTIVDFGHGDKIVITDAVLANFTFSVSGNTLTYAGGTLTFGAAPDTTLIASAAATGGVQLVLNSIVNGYDGQGRLISQDIYADDGSHSFISIDASATQAWSQQWFNYDAQGRLSTEDVVNDDKSHTFIRLDAGNTQSWSQDWFSYDAQGHLSSEDLVKDDSSHTFIRLDPANTQSFTQDWFAYDAQGRLDSEDVHYDDGTRTFINLDQDNTRSWAQDWFSYDAQGRLTSEDVRNDDGTHTFIRLDAAHAQTWAEDWFTYDAQGRLISEDVRNDDGSHTFISIDANASQSWSQQWFNYDAQGHLTGTSVVWDDGHASYA